MLLARVGGDEQRAQLAASARGRCLMKRQVPWFLVAFVLALLTLGLCADRPTRVFLDSPIGRASYLGVSRLLVPAVAVIVPAVKPGKFWLHLEARRSRPGPDESIPLRSNFSFDHALLLADDTGPPWIDLCGPPVLLRTAPRLKLQGPPGRRRPPNRGTSLRIRENQLPQKSQILQRVIFTTGFS
jgi:hypothetical protein